MPRPRCEPVDIPKCISATSERGSAMVKHCKPAQRGKWGALWRKKNSGWGHELQIWGELRFESVREGWSADSGKGSQEDRRVGPKLGHQENSACEGYWYSVVVECNRKEKAVSRIEPIEGRSVVDVGIWSKGYVVMLEKYRPNYSAEVLEKNTLMFIFEVELPAFCMNDGYSTSAVEKPRNQLLQSPATFPHC